MIRKQLKNIVIIILILALGFAAYKVFKDDIDYKNNIKRIQDERSLLEKQMADLEYRYDVLEKKKQKIKYIQIETENKLNNQENETDEIPGIVATYSNYTLDSILSNYRFKPRAKNRNSNGP